MEHARSHLAFLSMLADQDSVRLLAVESCGAFAQALGQAEATTMLLPIIHKFAQARKGLLARVIAHMAFVVLSIAHDACLTPHNLLLAGQVLARSLQCRAAAGAALRGAGPGCDPVRVQLHARRDGVGGGVKSLRAEHAACCSSARPGRGRPYGWADGAVRIRHIN